MERILDRMGQGTIKKLLNTGRAMVSSVERNLGRIG